jgi:RES domain-containing protein
VRYAARSDEGAARERYRDSGSMIPIDHTTHSLVTLTGRVRVLDLRQEWVLDELRVDDQISTSRSDPWWDAAHRLTDAVRQWWGEHVEGIVCRSRTTPETSTNLAFFAHAPLAGTSVPLAARADLLDRLVLTRGFTIDFAY